jgi:hypothetical protein
MKQAKILKAICRYCGAETYSLYKNQLDHNIEKHEKFCPERPKEESKEKAK